MAPEQLSADKARLYVPLKNEPVNLLCHLSFMGRRVWTFRTDRGAWHADTGVLCVEWPTSLVPYLTGFATVSVDVCQSSFSQPIASLESVVHFDGSVRPLELQAPGSGSPLVVNKWERLAMSFEDRSPEFVNRVLDSAEDLSRIVKETMGLELFVTGGTLLGPVREGQIMPHDDDADLAYLSVHDNPTDVVLESFAMERILRQNGFDLVRHSSGHLQIMFPGRSLTDEYYVDIFSYFVCNGWFYGTFHAREPADLVTIFPLSTVSVNGRPLPAPANTEQMLAAIYGSNWWTPDPAFKFVTPEPAQRRFYWWLNHFDAFREDWEDFHRSVIAADVTADHSTFAQWVADRIDPGSSIVDMGCGLGADARYFADLGHEVLATDYSRPAIEFSRAQSRDRASRPRYRVASQYSYRQMAEVAKETRQLSGAVNVFATYLLDGLHYLGRDVTLLTTKHILSRGGRAYFQMKFPSTDHAPTRSTEPAGTLQFEPSDFQHRVQLYGLEVEESGTVSDSQCSTSSIYYVIRKAGNP